MPWFREIVCERNDTVGEEDRSGDVCYVAGNFVVETAGPGGRAAIGATEIEKVGVANPFPKFCLRVVNATALVSRALDQFCDDAVVIERAVDALEDAALGAGRNLVIGVTAPDEPFHTVGADSVWVVDWVAPENAVAKIGEVGVHGDAALAEVGHALGIAGFLFSTGEGWQKHRGQDCDDGDNDEKFDQGESSFGFHISTLLRPVTRAHKDSSCERFSDSVS